MNARDIQRYITQTTDSEGNPVIQIPLHVWQQFISEKPLSQIEQIGILLSEWEQKPEEDMPDNWWNEFMSFLHGNRLTFEETDTE